MKRRTFLKQSSFLAFSVGAFGSISWNGQRYIGDTPTTTDILGPFYRPGAPLRSNLIREGATGEVLHFSGVVYGETDRKPISNALVEVWQCDEHGVYDNTSEEYRYRGSVKTGSDGSYFFKTVIPIAYKTDETHTRPAHIHMRISGTSYQDLITQVYFKGDPYIPGDASSSNPQSAHRIVPFTQKNANEKAVTFDIVMAKKYPLDAAALEKILGLYKVDIGLAEFYQKGNLLFMKWNGQIEEGLEYKGNNSFESGLGITKIHFELLSSGTKVTITNIDDDRKEQVSEGTKTLRYRE